MSTDETSIGRASRAVRRAGHSNLLIGGIAALAVVALLLTLLVYGKEIHDNHAAIARTNQVANGSRAETRSQIRQLACFGISQTPDNPKQPVIRELRARYHCPPYSRRNARRALKHLIPPAPPRSTVTVPGSTVTSTVPASPGKHRGRHHHHHR